MDTPTPATPIPVSGGMNIDQMLGNLSQQTTVAPTPVIASPVQTAPSMGTTFSIDALAKPVINESIEVPIKEQPSLSGGSRFAQVLKSPLMRGMAAFFSTCFVLAGWLWFMSVQYPIEAENYKTKILWLFSSTTQVVKDNLSSTGIESLGSGSLVFSENTEDLTGHSAAPAYDESTPTPLADAIAEQQDTNATPTSTEQTWDTALDTTSSGTTDPTINSWDIEAQDTVLWGVSDALTDPAAQKEQFKQTLASIKTTAETYLAQQTASNKGTIARVVSRNADSLLMKLETTPSTEYTIFSKEVEQLKGLADKLQ